MTQPSCPFCGAMNDRDAAFCGDCGRALAVPTLPPVASVLPPTPIEYATPSAPKSRWLVVSLVIAMLAVGVMVLGLFFVQKKPTVVITPLPPVSSQGGGWVTPPTNPPQPPADVTVTFADPALTSGRTSKVTRGRGEIGVSLAKDSPLVTAIRLQVGTYVLQKVEHDDALVGKGAVDALRLYYANDGGAAINLSVSAWPDEAAALRFSQEHLEATLATGQWRIARQETHRDAGGNTTSRADVLRNNQTGLEQSSWQRGVVINIAGGAKQDLLDFRAALAE